MAFGADTDKFARTFFIKRHEFNHESEVRLLFCDLNDEKAKNGVVTIGGNYNQVLDSVILDPRLPGYAVKKYKYKLIHAGCTLPIGQSKLYQIPELRLKY